MSNGAKFAVQLKAFTEKTNLRIDAVRRGVALRLFKAIIMDSPVLTGRLRANWQTTINIPARSSSLAEDTSGSSTIAAAASKIRESKLNDVLILTNSLPYVARIEYDGWSHTKAPKGMVRINLTRFTKLLGEEVRLAKSRS